MLITKPCNNYIVLEGELEMLQKLLSEKQTDSKETAKNAAVACDEGMHVHYMYQIIVHN